MTAGIEVSVDIGTAGGLALLSSNGELLNVAAMPVLADGLKGRPAVNAPLLAALLWRWAPKSAFVEYGGARPGEAVSGAFAFSRSRGVVEGVLGAQEVPTRPLTPSTWKRAISIPPGRDGAKDLARPEAVRRWPGQAQRFVAKGSDGLGEAALIAVAGMAREAAGR